MTEHVEVTVRLEDLRLLLQKAEPLLVSPETAREPVVDAIDRLGDRVAVATMRAMRGASTTGAEVLAKSVLLMAANGGMPDTFWLSDSRIAAACEALGWTPHEARDWALQVEADTAAHEL